MEINTKDIYEILGFKITCFTALKGSEVIKSYYTIRNHAGEIVSQEYKNVIEPLELLRKIENMLLEKKVLNNTDGHLS